jgi:hypothetical protein
MLRWVPQAAGPTGTVGRARTTQELHSTVRSGTAGCGLYRDHWPCTGSGSYASTHAHPGTAGRETIFGIAGCERAGGATRLGADLRVYACLSRHRRPREPQGDSGLRASLRSCVTRSVHTDVEVRQLLTVCLGYSILTRGEPAHCSCCCVDCLVKGLCRRDSHMIFVTRLIGIRSSLL